jgi:hypothetical protein
VVTEGGVLARLGHLHGALHEWDNSTPKKLIDMLLEQEEVRWLQSFNRNTSFSITLLQLIEKELCKKTKNNDDDDD